MTADRTVRVFAASRELATCTAVRCRRPIAFYRTYPREKRIPIDADAEPLDTMIDPATGAAIAVFSTVHSHFATCPAVASFRRDAPPTGGTNAN